MTKKDYMLKLLDLLAPIRPMALALKTLVEGNLLTEATMDSLMIIFDETINSVIDEEKREKLVRGKEVISKLKTIEAQEMQKDQKDLQELDELLSAI